MKLPIVCAQCMRDDLQNATQIASLEFGDDGKYEVVCPKGHKSITLLQQQKFELLFDIGAYAIVDGYYREAVSSFTSSLERCYEFGERGEDEMTRKNFKRLSLAKDAAHASVSMHLIAAVLGSVLPKRHTQQMAHQK